MPKYDVVGVNELLLVLPLPVTVKILPAGATPPKSQLNESVSPSASDPVADRLIEAGIATTPPVAAGV